MDLTESIAPKSDQLNAEDLLSGPRVFTVEKVTKGSAEQPVDIHLVEFPGRPFKPSKTVRRLLVMAWGPEASNYTGRKMMLYRDPAVRFGGMDVGGIRVSALSHITAPMTIALTVTRGRRAPFTVEPLVEPEAPPLTDRINAMVKAFKAKGWTVEQMEDRLSKSTDLWDADDVSHMTEVYKGLSEESK
jgi:hypothetical protein